MNDLLATVLVPTYNHGPTLLRSVASALDQTVSDIEIFIVGDGAVPSGKEAAQELCERDSRVRFFDNPKGQRHGEAYRHKALTEARGKIVCYLCDDDLWLPDHVESMLEALADQDFAGALPVRIDPGDVLGGPASDLALPEMRKLILSGQNKVPLSCGAHTLELYRKMDIGWSAAPEGTHTDLYMWQKVLSVPGVRARSTHRPTALHFPTSFYGHWKSQEKVRVLDRWLNYVRDPDWRIQWLQKVVEFTSRFRARTEFLGPQT